MVQEVAGGTARGRQGAERGNGQHLRTPACGVCRGPPRVRDAAAAGAASTSPVGTVPHWTPLRWACSTRVCAPCPAAAAPPGVLGRPLPQPVPPGCCVCVGHCGPGVVRAGRRSHRPRGLPPPERGCAGSARCGGVSVGGGILLWRRAEQLLRRAARGAARAHAASVAPESCAVGGLARRKNYARAAAHAGRVPSSLGACLARPSKLGAPGRTWRVC